MTEMTHARVVIIELRSALLRIMKLVENAPFEHSHFTLDSIRKECVRALSDT